MSNHVLVHMSGVHCHSHKKHWLCLGDVMAITMKGIGKKLCPQFVHDFWGFKKVDEKFKEVFSNLVALGEKLELDMQEDAFMNSLLRNLRSLHEP